MSETEAVELSALAQEAKDLRASIGVSQSSIAGKMGIAQPEVSQIELGRRNLAMTWAYVELLRSTPKEELLKKVATPKPPPEPTPEPVKAAPPPFKKSAITQEVSAFLRRHSMSFKEFAELSGISDKTVAGMARGFSVHGAEIVQKARAAMKRYEGENTPTSEQFKPTPKPVEKPVVKTEVSIKTLHHTTEELLKKAKILTPQALTEVTEADLLKIRRFGRKRLKEVREFLAQFDLKIGQNVPRPFAHPPPSRIPNPTPAVTHLQPLPPLPAEPAVNHVATSPDQRRPLGTPPEPKIKLVVEQGTRINNGENIAPLLRLDGKTMHVFTLVPGGVFVSYVAAEVEQR